ncbi:MAG: cheW [Gemmatimonadetes bacterium]|nr:cheW [Gemmatimonadota bacterium]
MSMPADEPTRERQVLEERARRLARPIEDTVDHAGSVDAVTFNLARERWTIDARYVFAVFRLAALVRVPGVRAPVIGVTRWRGDVLTLLDVRSLVGAVSTGLDDLAVVIVIGIDQPEFGVLADSLGDTIRLSDADVLPLTSPRGDADAAVIRGVTQSAHLILDPVALVRRQVGARRTASPATIRT